MRYSEFIVEGKATIGTEKIELVRSLWDSGMRSSKEIAQASGLKPRQVDYCLSLYHSDREGKRGIDPTLVDQVKTLWDQGLKAEKIAASLNVTRLQVEVILRDYYPDRGNKTEFNKVTPEHHHKVRDMYAAGNSFYAIAQKFDLNFNTVARYIRKQPDFEELKAKHLLNRESKSKQAATTKRLNAKPMSKGIKAIRKIGPVTGGKL